MSNEYLLRMRQQQYGATGNQNNQTNNYQGGQGGQSGGGIQQSPSTVITYNDQPNSYQPKPAEEDPNSCCAMICETWNLTLLIGTILSISVIVGLLIAYK